MELFLRDYYDSCDVIMYHVTATKHVNDVNNRICTHVLEIWRSFWFGPQVLVTYSNKNVTILCQFQRDNRMI